MTTIGVLIMAVLAVLLWFEMMRSHHRRSDAKDVQRSRADVVREIKQIEIHRPNHILRGDDL
jgi:uncharacterized membrane protein